MMTSCFSTVVEIEKENSLFQGIFQWGEITNVKVEGLGGVQTETSIQKVEDAWINSQAEVEYYRKIKDGL